MNAFIQGVFMGLGAWLFCEWRIWRVQRRVFMFLKHHDGAFSIAEISEHVNAPYNMVLLSVDELLKRKQVKTSVRQRAVLHYSL